MISGDSSCSDSGLEVRGGCANMRALYRATRVEAESGGETDCTPSPHSSLLDAPLPPNLINFPDSAASEGRLCKHSSIRIQQNAAR